MTLTLNEIRLFTAILFPDDIKEKLYNLSRLIDDPAANITRRENFHMTLVFIGETSRLSDAKNVVKNVNYEPFDITVSGSGAFRGGIVWAGIKRNDYLFKVRRELADGFENAGFAIEDGKFSPHLTLARRAENASRLPPFEPFTFRAERISLMRSDRINGKLTYTEIKI